jgi:hypothetical protein
MTSDCPRPRARRLIITNAAIGNPNVKALVYIAAFAPAQGEPSGTLATMFPGTGLTQANLRRTGHPQPALRCPGLENHPSWYLVANQDHAIPPAVERFMAHRMHAHAEAIDSSHVAMISHPDTVTDLIRDAAGN